MAKKPTDVELAVQKVTGMQPGLDRASLLPFYTDKSGRNYLSAPQFVYDAAKAFVTPGVAARGGKYDVGDVANMALNVTGAGLGASRVAGPTVRAGERVLGMGVGPKPPAKPKPAAKPKLPDPAVRDLAARYGTDIPKVRADDLNLPGRDWLSNKQRSVREAQVAAEKAGYAPDAPLGPITGYTERPMLMDPAKVSQFPGAMNEVPKPGNPKYDALMKSMSKKGYDPEQTIVVGVSHQGTPYIIEGNNRAAVARDLGLPAIPVEVRWYTGGERATGALSPDKLADYAYRPAPAAQDLGAKYGLPEFTTDLTPAQIEANRATFLKDSKTPPVLYHGTDRDYSSVDIGAPRRTDGGAGSANTDTGWYGRGFYLTPSPSAASGYAGGAEGANVLPLHAAIKNPFVIRLGPYESGAEAMDKYLSVAGAPQTADARLQNKRLGERKPSEQTAWLKSQGYDGVTVLRERPETDPKKLERANARVAAGYAAMNQHYAKQPLGNDQTAYDRWSNELRVLFEERAAAEKAHYATGDYRITEVVAFDPAQLKSTMNRGTFDPNEPNLSKARGGLVEKYAEGGPVVPGNIDLHNRPVVRNPDDSISTVLSITVGFGDKTYVLPRVVGGKVVSNQEAIDHFRQTGEHLGAYDKQKDAEDYSQRLHEEQAKEYKDKARGGLVKKYGV